MQLSVRGRHSVLALFIGDVDRLKEVARLAWDEAEKGQLTRREGIVIEIRSSSDQGT